MKKMVLDLETQKDFAEVGGRNKNHLLKISVCGVYQYESGGFNIFTEAEIHKLSELLQRADQIIGFNIRDFDFEVLRPYLNFDVSALPYLDMIEDLQKYLGHRIALDSIAQATLGVSKNGNGKQAIAYFRNSQFDQLKKYCLNDVKITRDIYEYGLRNHKVLYKDFFEIKEIPVQWQEPQPKLSMQKQSSLF